MGRPVFRPEPNGGPEAYKTYQIVAPLGSHYRDATCREVECQGWQHGFRSRIDVTTDLGQRQAAYIEGAAGRVFTKTVEGPLVTYDFPAGQPCFNSPHKVALEREPLYVVRDGDHRGNPYGTRPVTRKAHEWVDDFATHQQKINDAHERG